MSIHAPLPHGKPDPREGERLRDEALALLRDHRPALLRQLQRAFLQHLIQNGPATSDVVRSLVAIPTGVDPRVVGSAVRSLAEASLIISIGRRKSHRPESHARKVDVWNVTDEPKARHWLLSHPDFGQSDDTNDPFAI